MDQVYKKIHQYLHHKISFLKFFIKYILILHSFKLLMLLYILPFKIFVKVREI
jgi:hypothetical protein